MSYWDSEKLNRMYKCPKGAGGGHRGGYGGGGGGRYWNPQDNNNVITDNEGNSFSSPADYLNHDFPDEQSDYNDHHLDDHDPPHHPSHHHDDEPQHHNHLISHSQSNLENSSPNNGFFNFNFF